MAAKDWLVVGIALFIGAIACGPDFDKLFVGGAPCISDANCAACVGAASGCSCATSTSYCSTSCASGVCSATCTLSKGCTMSCAAGATCYLSCPNAGSAANCSLTCGEDGGVAAKPCGDHVIGVACNPRKQCD